MPAEPSDSFDCLSTTEPIETARGLLAEVVRVRSENERLRRGLAELKIEHQAVRDELARLKKLPPRPSIKPT
jgi:regulator of replication initiation timing